MNASVLDELKTMQTKLEKVTPSDPKQMQKLSYLKRMLENLLVDIHTLNTMPEKQNNVTTRAHIAMTVLRRRISEMTNAVKPVVAAPAPKPKKTVRISNTARLRVFRKPNANNPNNTENENRNVPVRNNQTRKYAKTRTRRVFNRPPNNKNKRLTAMYKKVKNFSKETV